MRSTSIQARAQRTHSARDCFLVTLYAGTILGLAPHFLFGQASENLWQKEHSKIEKIAQFTAKERAAILFTIGDDVLAYADRGTVRRLDLERSSTRCRWPLPVLSHDGRFLAYLGDGSSEGCSIRIFEIAASKERLLVDLPYRPTGLSWSWDDSEIAFFDLRTPLPSIWAASSRDGAVRLLVPSSPLKFDSTSTGIHLNFGSLYSLEWSHSGRELLADFTRELPTKQPNVYSNLPMVVRVQLAQENTISQVGDGYGAAVSPVADRVAWYQGSKIVAADLAGADRQVLTVARWWGIFAGDFKGDLVWAPDGNRMFFGVWESETCKDDVYLLSADTRHAKRFLRGTCITILGWR